MYFNYTEFNSFCPDHYSECKAFKDLENPLYEGIKIFDEYYKESASTT